MRVSFQLALHKSLYFILLYMKKRKMVCQEQNFEIKVNLKTCNQIMFTCKFQKLIAKLSSK